MIHKAGAIIIQDKKLLVLKTRGKPFFLTPGGKYEGEETTEECLKRELLEELQVTLKNKKHIKTFHFEKAAHSNDPLCLELYTVEYEGTPTINSEIESMVWLGKDDFFKKKYPLSPTFDTIIPYLMEKSYL